MKNIDIIIPCHNEEGNIRRFLEEFDKIVKMEGYIFEFIFVNDGSKDKTIDILKEEAKNNDKVKVIHFSRNFGKEAAMLAGLDYAKGDASIIVDADLEMPLHYILEMLEAWEKGYKLVLTYKANRKKGLSSSLASKFYDVYNKLGDSNILKDALDFQLMDREIVSIISRMREKSRFLKGLTGYLGFDYYVIAVDVVARTSGKSSFSGFRTLFGYAFKSLTAHSVIPLRVAINIAGIIGFISFIYMIYIFSKTIIVGKQVDGYASTIVIMLFLFSIVLFILGIMGYYLGKVYNEVKNRPNYIVDYVIKDDD